MKKATFFFFFITAQCIFFLLSINKQSSFTKLSYQYQKDEQILLELKSKKQRLANQLCLLQNPTTIKKIAQEKLELQPLQLKQIQRLPS